MNLIASIDGLAEANHKNRPALFLDRIAFVFLVVMVVCSPHSIAATQTASLIGMLAWIIRLFVRPRPSVKVSAVGIALIALFAWTAVSAVFSYEPAVSIDKLRGVAFFLIFIYVFNVIKNRRSLYFLAFALIGSCMINVAWSPVQKLIGRGVEVYGVVPAGPLALQGIVDGDVIVRVNGRKVNEPEDIILELQANDSVALQMNRLDGVFSIRLAKADMPTCCTAAERLGFVSWKRDRGFRAAGFYGHFTTYAEVLQLIGALTFGLLVAGFMLGAERRWLLILALCFGGIAFALLLTVTRASQLGLVISSMSIVVLGAGRRLIIAAIVIAIPVMAIGLYVLQQQRQVGFFDAKDGSIQYRQMMVRDGLRLWAESPRHLIVGVGMDSIKTHWQEWGLYDKGWQPMGHFHSTPLQLAVERGLPALLIWFILLGVYARALWRGLKSAADWRSKGILLGCIGGLIGFFASGIVHYNLGDREVSMVFNILMGLSMALIELSENDILLRDSTILQAAEARA